MFCPLCKSEYREGFARCTDCDVPLVIALPEQPAETADSASNDEDAPVLLWRGGNPVEYTALVAALRDAGISFYETFPRDFENTISSGTADRLFYGVPNFDIRLHRRDIPAGLRVLESLQRQQPQEAEPEEIGPDAGLTTEAVGTTGLTVEEQRHLPSANVEVWSGDDESQVNFLTDILSENQIPCRIEDGSEADPLVMIFVRPGDETRAREILREITEGTPLT